MKKAILCLLLILTMTIPVLAYTDDAITNDPVGNTYTGRTEAANMITNISFTDVAANHWAAQVITRMGALNIVKGDARRFTPESRVTKEQALAFIVRILGREKQALDAGAALAAANPDLSTAQYWSLGYLQIARDLGLITAADFNNARTADQAAIAPELFRRTDDASREQIADWIYRGLLALNPDAFAATANETIQGALTFSDWGSVDIGKMRAVEAMASNKIMVGSQGRFNPKAGITRAEMAQTLANMDSIYFASAGYEVKSATAGHIADNQYQTNSSGALWRSIYLRTADGSVDVLQYQKDVSSSPQAREGDAVVFKNGVTGMNSIAEGDVVEYIVDTATNSVLYVWVKSSMTVSKVTGKLYSVDAASSSINITDSTNKHFVYSAMNGLFSGTGTAASIKIDGKWHEISKLPYGSAVELTLNDNIAVEVRYVGQPVIYQEVRGIVSENDPDYGYLVVFDNSGKKQTYRYFEDDMLVEKTPYYDYGNSTGYISQVFPNFGYNSRSAVIADIEPGDIVFIRPASGQPDVIGSISAATNYIYMHGKVRSLSESGGLFTMLVEFEDKHTAWYDVPSGVYTSKAGKPVTVGTIMVGDWVKLLVNQAIITPGNVIESVKEIAIEGEERFISTIVKGNLNQINDIQRVMTVDNAVTLSKSGWVSYTNMKQFDLSGKDIEFYDGNKRVSLEYVSKFFKRSDATVYIGLERGYSGEKIKKVTFRIERDEALAPDFVTDSDGDGGFAFLGSDAKILTDEGTIVRRYGRLVGGQDILPQDYVSVVLNGNGKAAIVDIADAPGTAEVQIMRGRLTSVEPGKTITVNSISALYEMEWVYSPIQRTFDIDNRTVFMTAGGAVPMNIFEQDAMSTDPLSKVYYVIPDGARAKMVIEAPYVTRAVRGTITSVNGSAVMLNNASYYDELTGKWKPVSNTNAVVGVTMATNAITVKSNNIILNSGLAVGDQIRVMTDNPLTSVTTGMNILGYIILVEN